MFLAARAFELDHLGFRWDTNAYGSTVWMALGLHTVHGAIMWLGALAGPVVWLLSLEVVYAQATADCAAARPGVIAGVLVVALLVVTGGGLLSWRALVRARNYQAPRERRTFGRARFLAVSGLVLAVSSALLLLGLGVPLLFFRPCD